MSPRLGYGTGMRNSDMMRSGNGIGMARPKPTPLPTLVVGDSTSPKRVLWDGIVMSHPTPPNYINKMILYNSNKNIF